MVAGRAAGGLGPALPVLESHTRPALPSPSHVLASFSALSTACSGATHVLPAFRGQVLASFSALSTALEACTPKGARNKACECDLGLQSPSPTTTMEGKGAKGMLVSTETRQQQRGGGHEQHLSLLGPAVSCWP